MAMIGKLYGLCSACAEYNYLTKHHIYPKNWYGSGKRNNLLFTMCATCHSEFHHHYIKCNLKRNKLSKKDCVKILEKFISEKQFRKLNINIP